MNISFRDLLVNTKPLRLVADLLPLPDPGLIDGLSMDERGDKLELLDSFMIVNKSYLWLFSSVARFVSDTVITFIFNLYDSNFVFFTK